MAENAGRELIASLRRRVAGAGHHLRRFVDRLSLRARLLAVTLVLVAVGHTIAGIVTYTSLSAFLIDRVDDQLQAAQAPASEAVLVGREPPIRSGRRGVPGLGDLPLGIEAAYFDNSGRRISSRALGSGGELPQGSDDGFFTASLPDGSEYRFLRTSGVFFDPEGRLDYRFVVGIPLADVNDTLGRLVMIELLVGLGVLGAVGGLGLWLVRLGLRPLRDIEDTAGAIAGGDLSRRIDEADERTEVGRLGQSLNTMLGTIEESFKQREASERRLRQFVADASHELQTPLTSVRGYAELFRRGAADRPEDLANAMQRIEAESERMGLLVDDLLLLARLDQGRPLANEPVDLTAIARDLVTDARVVDPQRTFELGGDERVTTIGDEDRLRQVIANLLRNARMHTPPGTPVVVSIGRDGDAAVIDVSDTGPGMAPDAAARVFERFFRADPSRTRASGGTGLGLSIVSAIVAAHGGTVRVDTAPGDGARFRVVLPDRSNTRAPRELSVSDAVATSTDSDVEPRSEA